MDQEILIKRFQNKDVKAFEKLYELYKESISGVIFNIVRNQELTEELLQDVFIKAWTNADRYSSKKGRFFTWLLNIARNSAIDTLRSKNSKNNKKNVSSETFIDILANDEDLDSKTNAIGLKNILTKLADKCRKLIELIYFKGYSQQETSDELEIPLGTVKSRSRNCLKELRTLME
ncbi:MAG: sigma-70 family RNA polymerase sigma factor [Flavobacteriales bacterium]|nr:sigma-70 family RNA polymerase sigma factor [Flavobacteriales bacterium]